MRDVYIISELETACRCVRPIGGAAEQLHAVTSQPELIEKGGALVLLTKEHPWTFFDSLKMQFKSEKS